jgi:hypothetical protein
MVPGELTIEIDELRQEGWAITVSEMPDGFVHVVLDQFDLPAGFTLKQSRLLMKIPQSYPNGKPDMFWLEEAIRLENGAVPESAGEVENNHGIAWRRFSWHPAKWVPGVDSVRSYIEFVRTRLNHKR